MQNSVVQWLEETAKRFPDRTAYVDEERRYTWAEVRRTALSIAAEIRKVLPERKQPVAVYMKKSADMLAAYLGVAYSGNFYCPIDTDMPLSRIEKILETLRPALLFSSDALRTTLGGGGREIPSPA